MLWARTLRALRVRLSSAQHTADSVLPIAHLTALPQRLHAVCRDMPCRTAWHTVMQVQLPRAQGSGGHGHGLHYCHGHVCMHEFVETDVRHAAPQHRSTDMLCAFGAL